jgi:hypothetical protein
MNQPLRLNNPCPFQPTRATETSAEGAAGFYCKGCSKTITDMSGKTVAEVQEHISAGKCGVYTVDQLPHQPRGGVWWRMRFKGLALLSLLGFGVAPMRIHGQNNPTKPTQEAQFFTSQSHEDEPENSSKKNKNKTKKLKKSKKKLAGF